MAWRRITLLVEAVVDEDGEIPEISCGSDIACLEDLTGSVAITKIQDVRIMRREAQSLMSIHGVHPDLLPAPSWALFEANRDNRERPEIQKIDEEDPDDQIDDLDAAVSFVHDLERGEPEALTAAETFIDFYSGVEHRPGRWEGGMTEGEPVHVPDPVERGEAGAESALEAMERLDGAFRCLCGGILDPDDGHYPYPDPCAPPFRGECARNHFGEEGP